MKQTVKRVYPGFNESYYGYRTFAELLEDAAKEGVIHARARRAARQLPRPNGLAAHPAPCCALRHVGVAGRRQRATILSIPGSQRPPSLGVHPLRHPGQVYASRELRMAQQGSKVVRDGVEVVQGAPSARLDRSTLFLRLWRVKGPQKTELTRAALYMVRPGNGAYVVKELIPDMELGPQAAVDKAIAIAKRGDVSTVYLNADLDAIPELRFAVRCLAGARRRARAWSFLPLPPGRPNGATLFRTAWAARAIDACATVRRASAIRRVTVDFMAHLHWPARAREKRPHASPPPRSSKTHCSMVGPSARAATLRGVALTAARRAARFTSCVCRPQRSAGRGEFAVSRGPCVELKAQRRSRLGRERLDEGSCGSGCELWVCLPRLGGHARVGHGV